jgi:hypothetical protein
MLIASLSLLPLFPMFDVSASILSTGDGFCAGIRSPSIIARPKTPVKHFLVVSRLARSLQKDPNRLESFPMRCDDDRFDARQDEIE